MTASDVQGGDPPTAARVRYGGEATPETGAGKHRRTLQVGVIVRDTLEKISPAARHILALAALLPPDMIVVEWLRVAGARLMPADSPLADPWLAVLNELLGRRLLVAVEFDPHAPACPRLARLHRLVGEHLLASLSATERASCA